MANRHRPRQSPTTLIVTPTFATSVFQGTGIGTATDLAPSALPTQLVFDSSAVSIPVGAATTGNAATVTISPVLVGTASADPKSVVIQSSTAAAPSSTPSSEPTATSHNDVPVAAIIMAIVAAAGIASLFIFLWYRKRARRRGHAHSRVESHDVRGPPAGDVLRKLATTGFEKSDPFSDAHAEVDVAVDPFADPEKGDVRHNRSGSDSFLSMSAPRQPYTHAMSASTGSSASGKVRRKEMEEAREKDMMALNNLVRALDQKERKAEQEGRDRKSLPPVELFKAALVR